MFADPTLLSDRHHMSGDQQARGRHGQKIVVKHPSLPPMPKHVKERVRRIVDEALFNPPVPEKYRTLFERLDRETAEREDTE